MLLRIVVQIAGATVRHYASSPARVPLLHHRARQCSKEEQRCRNATSSCSRGCGWLYRCSRKGALGAAPTLKQLAGTQAQTSLVETLSSRHPIELTQPCREYESSDHDLASRSDHSAVIVCGPNPRPNVAGSLAARGEARCLSNQVVTRRDPGICQAI